jgi:hypothetical protein
MNSYFYPHVKKKLEFNWGKKIKHGQRTGKPISVNGRKHWFDMILEDGRIGLKWTPETFNISHERVFHIIHHELDITKLS